MRDDQQREIQYGQYRGHLVGLLTIKHLCTHGHHGVDRSTSDLIRRLDKMGRRGTMDSQGHPIQGLIFERTMSMSMREAHIASVVKSDVVFGKSILTKLQYSSP